MEKTMATQSGSSHRNSIAWQKGMDLAKAVYKVTQRFPADERFGLTNQLRRAAVSVPSNIAEGRGRLTTGKYVQFLGIARGSTLEVQTQLELASMFGFGERVEMAEAQAIATEEIRILNSALATLRAQISAKKQR
jgi:four helix bundle protein